MIISCDEIIHAAKIYRGNTFKLWALLQTGMTVKEIIRANLMPETTANSCFTKIMDGRP